MEITPVAVLPPCTPFTSHVTLWSVAPVNVAINCCEAPALSATVIGATETVIGGGGGGDGFTVTLALADFDGSALLLAVTDRAN